MKNVVKYEEFKKLEKLNEFKPSFFCHFPGIVRIIHSQSDWDEAVETEKKQMFWFHTFIVVSTTLFLIVTALAFFRISWYLALWGIK